MTLIKTTAAAAVLALGATAAAVIFGTTSPSAVHADIPPAVLGQVQTPTGPMPSLAPMLKNVLPAVVNIAVTSKVEVQNPLMQDPFFKRFFNVPDQAPQEQEAQAIGSGVIVDAAKGYVVTNNHVIDQADSIKVKLNDDREYDAKLIGKDPESDLAVLQIKAEDLKQLAIADSDALQVGDFVVAIGSPFALNQTVTSGIVSALGRATPDGGDGIQDFIQTDASINPGNSGGALVNLKGELVGIPSQILSRSGGNMGIGFAIPTNLVKSVMTQLIATGSVNRGRIGIGIQPLNPQLAKAFGLKDTHGALVTQVTPGSPAAKAGIKVKDVIISANGREIVNAQQLHNTVGVLSVGDKINLKLIRDGSPKEISVEVGKAPEKVVAATGKVTKSKLAGVTLGEVTDGDSKGVQITAVDPASAAARAGLRPGDIIVAVNNKPIAGVDDFNSTAGSSKDGQLLLQVQRGNGMFFLVLQ
ncbi:MAG: DegQ family serine endoprotease [Nevskia sp.]|nr:DegQ family serine endoprotease [Nevskia sp.]